MRWVYDDGGRVAAGFRGDASDCVVRSIAIVTGRPYREIYAGITELALLEKYRRGRVGFEAAVGRRSSARDGVLKVTRNAYIDTLGLEWTATMRIGSGCRVHLRDGELPMGRLLVACSQHLTAVIDGVIHDTHDPGRDGTRCVYGYWAARP